MNRFQSTKLIDGFSTCYRDWRDNGNLKYLHGSALSFRLWFEGELDYRNWVADFGLFKRAKGTIDGMNPKDYFNYMFDHTVIISVDDPYLNFFKQMEMKNIIQLRIIPTTGIENFAEFIFNKVNPFILEETEGRVKATKVEVYEHERNSVSYGE